MPYDPNHHHRRSIRLRGYDYTQPGAYFITVCTYAHIHLFGEVVEGQVHLNACGRIVAGRWRALPRHGARVRLGAFVVMPNHIHGILIINPPRPAPASSEPMWGRGEASDQPGKTVPVAGADPALSVGAVPSDASPLQGSGAPRGTVPGSLGAIVQQFKSITTRKINRLRGTPGAPVWQRGYWDRILRDERAGQAACRYIEENPARWEEDNLYRVP